MVTFETKTENSSPYINNAPKCNRRVPKMRVRAQRETRRSAVMKNGFSRFIYLLEMGLCFLHSKTKFDNDATFLSIFKRDLR